MSSGLVGHWKFNEKSGTVANDSSRYRNTGTLTGATHLPKWGEKGIIFDGVDDYVNAGNDASLNMSINNFTIISNINTSYSIANTGIVFKMNLDGGTNYHGYGMVINYGIIGLRIGHNDMNITPYAGSKQVNTGNWIQSAIVVDRSNNIAYFYTNGSFDVSRSIVADSGITTNNPSPLYIGYSNYFVKYFNGSIDEVRIYNRALSASEIKRLYNSTKHKYI